MKQEREELPGAPVDTRSAIAKAAVPAAIVLAVLLLALIYISRPAWVWDERYYYTFSAGMRRWFAAPSLDEGTVNAVFREGNAHPPLPIYATAITGALFQADVTEFLLAVRLSTALQFAGLALLVYLFVKREAGATAGGIAAVLTVFSPRLFAHSLMATYDVPMSLLWVATTVAFYRGMRSRRWAIATGFVFGLALLTKVNALLLPLALWPWGLYFHRKKALPAIGAMCLIGPVVFFAGWPWLWMHPVRNAAEYIVDKFPPGVVPSWFLSLTGTEAIAWRETPKVLYLGKVNPAGAPWHYPFFMLFLTMPVATLAGSCLSAVEAKRRETHRPLITLLWWSVLVQLLVFAFAMKPFDGVRLFLPVLPLAAMAAGIALGGLLRRGKRTAAAVVVLVLLSPVAEFFVYAPYGMSYFTPLVGGLPGAENLGMEVTYYGEAVDQDGLTALKRRAREGQRVAYAPLFKKLPLLLPSEYIRYGFLKWGLEPVAPSGDWDYLIFINRGGEIDETDRSNLARGEVIHENRLLGVTLSKILARKGEPDGGENAPGAP
ncbi:MAG: ArnT family glycosyltransferase [Planctomycetota bacterium]